MDNSIALQLVPDVLAARGGDLQAYGRLISRCRQLVSSIALAISRDLDASEDIAQQVFIAVWQQLPQLKEPASFLPWLRQITRYQAYHQLRANDARRQAAPEDSEVLLAEFIDPDANPELWHSRSQQAQLLQQFLDALPADSRDVLLLYYREEQSSQQVAALLGLSEAAVRKKLQRLREQLKAQWLARYGQLILSTAPTAGFSTALLLSLASLSPPAAAAVSSSLAAQAGKSGVWYWLSLLGGAAAGALLALVAVFYGMKPAIDRADSAEQKQALRQLRKRTLLWLTLFGIGWVAAYELTTGAWAPILMMSLLSVLLLTSQQQFWRLTAPTNDGSEAHQRRRRDLGWLCVGTLLGLCCGWAGMLLGLIQSGRW